uniref:RNase III domain-containing protein n=1 Tax=viral metagenome TaxID=1070528 RepID=A0A6C0LSH3_9ZZZZ
MESIEFLNKNLITIDPISALKMLSDFIKISIEKSFELKKENIRCKIKFEKNEYISGEFDNKKDAEKEISTKILNHIPSIEYLQLECEGPSHNCKFKYHVFLPSKNDKLIKILFEQNWMKKKVDAKRNIVTKICNYYLGTTLEIEDNSTKFSLDTDQIEINTFNHLIEWQSKNLSKIKSIINLNNISDDHINNILTIAFIHSSYTNNLKEEIKSFLKTPWSDYETLEFYGDSIFGFIVSKMLLEKNLHNTPGDLTLMRQNIINGKTCYKRMKELKLDKFIIHKLNSVSDRIIANVYEAIIGALYYCLGDKSNSIIMKLIGQI